MNIAQHQTGLLNLWSKEVNDYTALGELIEEKGHKANVYCQAPVGGLFLEIKINEAHKCYEYSKVTIKKRGNDFFCDHPIPGIPVSFLKNDPEFRFKICI